MHGIRVILKKELADHFSGYRFIILFALIAMVSVITAYMAATHMRESLEAVRKPGFVFLLLFTTEGAIFSLIQFVGFFGPFIGLILGFDAINREKNEGTLSRLLSQPIYRDSVINGKFLAGVVLITVTLVSIVLVVTGLGLNTVGVIPGGEGIARIVIFLVISIFYVSLWLGVGILFSILFRSVATSALASLAAWIFFTFFVPLGASVAADAFVAGDELDSRLGRRNLAKVISLASPMELYRDSSGIIIDPRRQTTRGWVFETMGFADRISHERFWGPLSLEGSFSVVLPHIIFLIAITAVCFAISYLVFMRQEIRSL